MNGRTEAEQMAAGAEIATDIVLQARWYMETITGLQRNRYSTDLIAGLLEEIDRMRNSAPEVRETVQR